MGKQKESLQVISTIFQTWLILTTWTWHFAVCGEMSLGFLYKRKKTEIKILSIFLEEDLIFESRLLRLHYLLLIREWWLRGLIGGKKKTCIDSCNAIYYTVIMNGIS